MAWDRTREAVRDGDGLWQASIALRQVYRNPTGRKLPVSWTIGGAVVQRSSRRAVAVPKRGD